jgi:hypothetical protein
MAQLLNVKQSANMMTVLHILLHIHSGHLQFITDINYLLYALLDSKSGVSNDVSVQVRPGAPPTSGGFPHFLHQYRRQALALIALVCVSSV